MLKIWIVVLLVTPTLARPEPPVSSYLPPTSSYGVPEHIGVGIGGGSASLVGGFARRPWNSYDPPGQGTAATVSPSSTFDAPDFAGSGPGFERSAAGNVGIERPSSKYGAPGVEDGGTTPPSNSYGASDRSAIAIQGIRGGPAGGRISSYRKRIGSVGENGFDDGAAGGRSSNSYGRLEQGLGDAVPNGFVAGFGGGAGGGRLSNNYGPPGQGIAGRLAPASSKYSTPGQNRIVGAGGTVSGSQPFATYGAPGQGGEGLDSSGNTPSNSYGPPAQSNFGRTGGNYSSVGGGNDGGRLSSSYGPLKFRGSDRSGFSDAARPWDSYGRPNGDIGGVSRRPSSSYGALGQGTIGDQGGQGSGATGFGSIHSDSYGLPASGTGIGGNDRNGVPADGDPIDQPTLKYLPPTQDPQRGGLKGKTLAGINAGLGRVSGSGSRNGSADGYGYAQSGGFGGASSTGGGSPGAEGGAYKNNEPAKYEFNYQVEDDPSGLSFGHFEMRYEDFTTGEYNVLLPDGRKQIVQYEADQGGYRPQIRYKGEVNNSGAVGGRGAGSLGASRGPEYATGYDYSQNQAVGAGNVGFGSISGDNGFGAGRPKKIGFSSGQDVDADDYSSPLDDNGNGLVGGTGGRYRKSRFNAVSNENAGGRNLGGNGYTNGQPSGNTGQNLGDDGYSSGQPSGSGLFGSAGGRPGGNNGQNQGVDGYSRGQPGADSFGGVAGVPGFNNRQNQGVDGYSNGQPGRFNGNGQGYPSERPKGTNGTFRGTFTGGSDNDYNYDPQGGRSFGPGGQNGDNDGRGYRY